MSLFGNVSMSGIGDLLSGLGSVGAGIGAFIGTGKQQTRAFQFQKALIELQQDWQERMSNSAHQREVEDLKAAGLNPVLSAMGGSGATYGSANASGSFSGENPITSAINTALAFRQAKADYNKAIQDMSESNSRESLNRANKLFTQTQENIALGDYALRTALNAAQIDELKSRMNLNTALSGKAEAEKGFTLAKTISQKYGFNLQKLMSDFYGTGIGKFNYVTRETANTGRSVGNAFTSFIPKLRMDQNYDSHNYYGDHHGYYGE